MPPQQVSPVAHAPTGGTSFASLWRTRGYLQPYRWQLVFLLVAALVAAASEIVIPLLTKSVIDGAIAHHQRGLLLPLGAAAIALGVSQAVLNLVRRWVQASAVAGMERSMRADLYAHLQRLHAGFHDEWQSGQLLSRATTDLSAIRRFAGFGTIFLITNVATFGLVVASALLVDYILTVAVSTASGVANIGSAVGVVGRHPVEWAVGIIIVITALNLRGIRESGTAFAIPVYAFMVSIMVMILTGLARWVLGSPMAAESAGFTFKLTGTVSITGIGFVFLLAKAFSSGSSALT